MTLELDGADVTPERFQRAIRAFFGMVGEVTKSVCEGKPRVEWRVQVKKGSNLIGMSPVPGFRPETVGLIASTVREGLASLDADGLSPPPHFNSPPLHFNDAALRHVHELADIVIAKTPQDFSIRLWTKKQSLPVTDRLAASSTLLLTGQVEDYGSIDGRLQTLSERGALRFVIYETLSDRGVPCFIEPEQWDAAMSGFRKRVEVYGLIKYRLDGVPVSIKVDEIVHFPAREDVPDFNEVHGILRAAD
jgi:hypothetical protein